MAKSNANQTTPGGRKPVRKGQSVEPAKQTKKQIAHSRKETRQNRIIFASVGAVALIILGVATYGVVRLGPSQAASPVAIVNGNKIRYSDYEVLLTYNTNSLQNNINYLQSAIQSQSSSSDQTLTSFYQQMVSQYQSQLATVDSTTLDELIDDELIREKAQQVGLSVSSSEVQQAIDQDLQNAAASSQPTATPTTTATGTTTATAPTATPIPQATIQAMYQNALTNMGINDQQFRTIVERSLLSTKLQDLLSSEVPTTGLIVHVQMIVTSTQEAANAALQRIQNGEDFATVAKEVSSDSQVKTNGGDIGWLAQGQASRTYGQAFEEWIFNSANTPGTVGVVNSNSQYHVVKIVERNDNGPLPTEELSYRQSNALTNWLAQIKSSPDTKIERLLITATPATTPTP